MLNFI